MSLLSSSSYVLNQLDTSDQRDLPPVETLGAPSSALAALGTLQPGPSCFYRGVVPNLGGRLPTRKT